MKKVPYLVVFLTLLVFGQDNGKISPPLLEEMTSSPGNNKVLVWVFFTDKGNETDKFFTHPASVISEKSLQRRLKYRNDNNNSLDFTDLPLNPEYIDQVVTTGFTVRQKSKWFNGISGYTGKENIARIAAFPFVDKIDLVYGFKKDYNVADNDKPAGLEKYLQPEGVLSFNYGTSYTQLQQINVPAVHNLGYYGQGITICVMDAGFNRLTHESFSTMNIIAAWDFVNGDPNVGDENDMGTGIHGTQTLSTIGGFKEGKLIGPAFDADYILAKTENTDSETPIEEDNWIAAMEWADSIGVDVTSTSLGYLTMDPGFPGYSWQDMDGNTTIITRGADLATHKGIVVVNSAGNEGYNGTPNTLAAPADGDSVIAVGAVYSSGSRVGFSSYGPTVDGRIKPDIMAMGSEVYVASPYNNTQYTYSSGTSFSCPLAAGVAALILSYNPNLNPMQVRDALRNTASQNNTPDSLYGWGIPNAVNAIYYFPSPGPPLLSVLPAELSNLNYNFGAGPSQSQSYNLSGIDLVPSAGNITVTASAHFEVSADDIIFSSWLTIPYSGSALDTVPVYVRLKSGLPGGLYSVEEITNEGGGDTTRIVTCSGEVISTINYQMVLNVTDGWNLVSIFGLHPVNQNVNTWWVYRDPAAYVFRYAGNYLSVTNATPGTGYWVKHLGAHTYNTGDEWPAGGILIVPHDPIAALLGWNLIGGYEQYVPTAALTTTPPDLIAGSIYKYTTGYVAATVMEPGYGYWIKLTGAGSIIIPSSPAGPMKSVVASTEEFGKITISDNAGKSYTLYAADGEVDLNQFELPPLPPQGMFDVRYSSQRYVERLSSTPQGIELMGVVNPIKVKAESVGIILTDETGKEIARLKAGEEVTVTAAGKLYVTEDVIPTVYALEQNYPNPFNPSTTIQFSIPEDVQNVKLIIYSALGEKVAELVNTGLQAGIYKYPWDASKYASGIYIYQIVTEKFISTRKMILLR